MGKRPKSRDDQPEQVLDEEEDRGDELDDVEGLGVLDRGHGGDDEADGVEQDQQLRPSGRLAVGRFQTTFLSQRDYLGLTMSV